MAATVYKATGQVYNCYHLYRRTGPSTSYKTNGSYNKGDKVNITKKDGSWYYVDNKGWSQSAYIKITSSVVSGKVKITEATKLYESKSTSSKVLKNIIKGTSLEYIEKSGYWYKVTYKGTLGWVYVKNTGTDSNNSSTGSATTKNATIIYEKANTSSKIVGRIAKNTNVSYTKKSGSWYYITATITSASGGSMTVKGWAQASDLTNISSKSISELNKEIEAQNNADAKILYKSFLAQYNSSQSVVDDLITNNMNGIHGIPYQFMSTVDPKLSSDSPFGAIYADKIVSSLPLLLLTPGKVEFMADYKKDQKEGILALLKDVTDGDASFKSSDISAITDGESGRYYSFAFDYDEYWKYVDSMMNTIAIFMGIQDVQVTFGKNGSKKLGNMSWADANNTSFGSYLSATQDTIGFYVDSVNTVDENFGNDLTDSQLASKVNSFSDYGREVRFLLGWGGAANGALDSFLESTKDTFTNAVKDIGDFTGKFLGQGTKNLFNSIGDCFQTVASGGKIAFPQIWSDSSFSRSYNISMKLRCPEPNPVSWYLDICAPLIHLLAMTMPRQTNPDGYNSPFLVRAFYKGLFNCDMGIITNVSITKGKEGAWTVDGLPTQVDVSIEIKDLYNVLYMTEYRNQKWFMNNPCFLNYLGTMCGININEVDMVRDLMVYLMLSRKNMPIISSLRNQWTNLQQDIDNKLMKMYNNNILKW